MSSAPDDLAGLPEVVARRPFNDDDPEGYRESDKDFVANNLRAAVWFLEHHAAIDSLQRQLSEARDTLAQYKARGDRMEDLAEGRLNGEIAAKRQRQEAERQLSASRAAEERMRTALQGMLDEWDRLTRYGSPMAKAANPRVASARAALSPPAAEESGSE